MHPFIRKAAHRFPAFRVIGVLFGGWLSGNCGISTVLAEPQSCVDCHRQNESEMVKAWEGSRHAAAGVGCIACHGDNHSTIFQVKGQVSAATCGSCHSKQVTEFNRSLHAESMDRMEVDPKFQRLSPAMAEQGCVQCHKIGKHFPDGSRGGCNSCHSGHSFSVIEARRPESCGGCHSGRDHPHIEMWQASKHGQLFASEATRAQAPTCVTCHMPGGSHDTGIGLTLGNVGTGAALDTDKPAVKMRSITAEEAKRQRALMVANCLPCHSSRFASESLAGADHVKQEADAVLGEAAAVINQLQHDKLIRWLESGMPPDEPEVPAGHPGDSESLPEAPQPYSWIGPIPESIIPRIGGAEPEPGPLPGTEMPYDGLTPLEQRFFEMVKFHHATTFKGAYHHSPMFTHNEGFLRMQQDLSDIKNKAEQIRSEAKASHPTQPKQP